MFAKVKDFQNFAVVSQSVFYFPNEAPFAVSRLEVAAKLLIMSRRHVSIGAQGSKEVDQLLHLVCVVSRSQISAPLSPQNGDNLQKKGQNLILQIMSRMLKTKFDRNGNGSGDKRREYKTGPPNQVGVSAPRHKIYRPWKVDCPPGS